MLLGIYFMVFFKLSMKQKMLEERDLPQELGYVRISWFVLTTLCVGNLIPILLTWSVS
jgi:hypothetical protein